ncbi:DoxX family protein [Flavobacterium sp. RHBU_3]|uniref:DoxX family protein n=1 Tax=Flavobacterium sp. RHBU_3 TaxID=3391184 RepID=UPI003984EDDE
MSRIPTLREATVKTVCFLYILLFVYAAVSKLLDFDNFRAQLGQSPLLSAFAHWLALVVPGTELLVALFLTFRQTRITALSLGFGIMVMFSTYIYFILTYSPYVPCSCGGVLEGLGWNEHLIFNLAFVAAAAFALVLGASVKKIMLRIGAPAITGTLMVIGGYMLSGELIARENPFVRRFIPLSIAEGREVSLPNPNFYFSGFGNGKVYLGNIDSPLYFLAYNNTLQRQDFKASIEDAGHTFKSLSLSVAPPYFYLFDGSVPTIYKGNLKDGLTKEVYNGPRKFTKAAALRDNTFAIRGQLPRSGEHQLLFLNHENGKEIIPRNAFLEKQIDGVFDTEGMLLYSQALDRFVYTYYYRNQFLVADGALNLLYRGKTIDTVSKAQLKIVKIKSTGDVKLASPPLTVNKTTAVCGNLLFVRSGLRGRYETPEVWRQASVIDVYDIAKNEYVSSFYVYNIEDKPFQYFIADHNGLYTITGNKLHFYPWGKPIKKVMNIQAKNYRPVAGE